MARAVWNLLGQNPHHVRFAKPFSPREFRALGARCLKKSGGPFQTVNVARQRFARAFGSTTDTVEELWSLDKVLAALK